MLTTYCLRSSSRPLLTFTINVTTLRFAPSNFIPSLTKVSLELTQHRINHVRRIKDTAEAKAMTTTPKMPYL